MYLRFHIHLNNGTTLYAKVDVTGEKGKITILPERELTKGQVYYLHALDNRLAERGHFVIQEDGQPLLLNLKRGSDRQAGSMYSDQMPLCGNAHAFGNLLHLLEYRVDVLEGNDCRFCRHDHQQYVTSERTRWEWLTEVDAQLKLEIARGSLILLSGMSDPQVDPSTLKFYGFKDTDEAYTAYRRLERLLHWHERNAELFANLPAKPPTEDSAEPPVNSPIGEQPAAVAPA